MSYSRLFYHFIFSTKHRKPLISAEHERFVYQLIFERLKQNGCHVLRIGGMREHVHILTSCPPSVSISSLMQNVKQSTSYDIKHSNKIPLWEGWEEGYGAFSVSAYDTRDVFDYIKNQKEHHKQINIDEELRKIMIKHGVDPDKEYFQYLK